MTRMLLALAPIVAGVTDLIPTLTSRLSPETARTPRRLATTHSVS